MCRAIGNEGQLLECPSGLIYDPLVNLCRAKRHAAECVTFDCTRKFNEFIRHPKHPAYYAFCVTPPNRPSRILVFKCRDDVNYEFSLVTKKCEFKCKRRGEHVDREECESYISCQWERGKYVWTRINCPTGHYFDTNKCVPYQANAQRCVPIIPRPPPPPPPPPAGGGGTGGGTNN